MAAFNNQMMAQALRRPQIAYPTGGGTVGRPMAQSLASGPPVQQLQQSRQPSLSEMKQNAELMNKGMEKFKGWFGAGGTTGADIGAGAQYYGPEVAKMGGSVVGPGSTSAAGGGGWLNGLGNMFGGGGAGGAGAGAGSTAGGLGALLAGSIIADKEMNENKGSIINADKINDMGSVNGIGLRGGDLINGFNPATWASDPKKAAKGLGNAFTFGLLDKIF